MQHVKNQPTMYDKFVDALDEIVAHGKDDIYKKDIIKFTTELYKFKCKNDNTQNFEPFVFCKHLRNWVEKYIHKKKHIHITPRGSFKSTFWTHIYPLWRIYQNPNTTILIIATNQDAADERVKSLKEAIENNPQLGLQQGNTWGTTKFSVKRTNSSDPNPTVAGLGKKGKPTGKHPDLVIVDDMIVEDDCVSETNMAKDTRWFNNELMKTISSDKAQIIVVGTRKHFAELYSELLNNPTWSKCVEKAILREPQRYKYIRDENDDIIGVNVYDKDENGHHIDTGEIFCDECRSMEYYLMKILDGQNAFEREFQNNPMAMELGHIHNTWIRYYDWTDVENKTTIYIDDDISKYTVDKKDLTCYMGVDLSYGLKKASSDWFSICIVGVDSNNRIYVLESFASKHTPSEQDEIIRMKYDEWKCQKINIDKAAYQKVMTDKLGRKTTMYFDPNAKAHSHNKSFYWDYLGSLFQKGKMFLNKTTDTSSDRKYTPTGFSFRDELVSLPNSKHDDRADALVFAVECIPQYRKLNANSIITVDKGSTNARVFRSFAHRGNSPSMTRHDKSQNVHRI